MKERSLLLLGGSASQIAAIDVANRLGYRTVLCDYLEDNPGQYLADSFHLVSTTDLEGVLSVARSENVSGVVAYSSDPAAPTAAYVARELGLPGVPYDIACSLCEKHLFRSFLIDNGFNAPRSASCAIGSLPDVSDMSFPLIVKPTDSSGSKGVTVVESSVALGDALEEAARYSRNGIVEVEEFIERDHPHVIEAEIFVVGGRVVSWGLMNSIRDAETNPLLPAAYTLPLDLPVEREGIVRAEVSRLVAATGVDCGAFNIEMVIDKDNRLFFLDAGPRNGGNMLPEFISAASGRDIVAATVLVAMGDVDGVDVSFDGKSGGHWGLGVLHATRPGVFGGVSYSRLARERLVREELGVSLGETLRPFSRCNDLAGLAFFKFENKAESDAVMLDMNRTMGVIVR